MAPLQWPPLLLLLISSTFIVTPSSSLGAPLQALVTPITKDTLTSLYSISLNNGKPFVIDLTTPFVWSPCLRTHPTIPCNSTTCSVANSFRPYYCHRVDGVHRKACACKASVLSPEAKTCSFADLTFTDITIFTTDGRRPTAPITIHGLVSSCAQRSIFANLPRGSAGIVGLSRSTLALSSQLSAELTLKPQFAICLPSTSNTPGVAFFGNNRYFLLSPMPDMTTVLSYTPLLRNPMNKQEYYIDLKGVVVNGEAVQFLARILEFDSLGQGGVILNTAVPYTTLRSHVYHVGIYGHQ